MNLQSIPSRIFRKLTRPVLRTGSVVFFEHELAVPIARTEAPAGFAVRLGSLADLQLLKDGLPLRTEAQLRERFERGDLCMLVTDPSGRLAHASWIALSSAWIPELEMTLTVYPGEAYGYDFYTRADLRKHRVFSAARTFLCDHLVAIGFERFFIYVTGDNRSGLAGAATWQKPMGRLSYVRLRGTRGLVWGHCPFTLARGRPAAPATTNNVTSTVDQVVASPPEAAPAPAPALRVQVVADAAALLRMRPVWDGVVERAGLDHPFLTHEWICAWWEAFGGARELRILAVYSGGTCIAIAPLMLERKHMYGLPVRSLELIGNEHTPRSGFIVAERPDESCRALLEAMNQLGERWSMVVLPQLAAGTQTLEQMERVAKKAGISTGVWHGPASPRLELNGSWDSYLKSLRPKQRTNLRNRVNRLQRLGKLELEEINGGPELHAALDSGLRIEALGWKGEGATAMASHPDSNRFYRRFAEAAAARGWLCLNFLKVGERRIAFSYGVRFQNVRYLIKQGFDPEFSAASPSQVLCSMMLQDGFKRGERAFDFLGADEPWKREWTADSRAHSWLYLFQPGLQTWSLHFAKFRLLPALRQRWLAASA